MPLLCMKCDTRVEGLLTKPGKFWCPECDKELTKDEVYRVGKRFFAGDVGTIIAAATAMSAILPTQGRSGTLKERKEKVSAFVEAKRKKRKKLKGLKVKQRRHERRKNDK